jgi:hypothetical protein
MQDHNIRLDDLHLENSTAYSKCPLSGPIFCLPRPLFEDGHEDEGQYDSKIDEKELLG